MQEIDAGRAAVSAPDSAGSARGSEAVRALEGSMRAVIRGKPEAVRLALVALLAGGHLLIEDVPGTGKTTLAGALARSIDGTFHRIQFTADLLPSDVTGLSFYDERTNSFEFKPGPVFANVLLADEINRATPKTQSALLEAMAENQVTVEGESRPLPSPFVVLATQNPVEHQGTFPLPESQLDRFMLRMRIGYPDRAAEREIIESHRRGLPLADVLPVADASEIAALRERVGEVRVDDRLVDYLLAVVEATRTSEMIDLGVSPRGTLALYRAAQARALIEERSYCIADDIKRLVVPVCAHRLIVNNRFAAAGAGVRDEAEIVLGELLKSIGVPL